MLQDTFLNETNEELLACLKSLTEEMVERLGHFGDLEYGETPEGVNDGILFGTRTKRMLFRAFVDATAVTRKVEESSV